MILAFIYKKKKVLLLQKIGDGFVKSMPYIIKTIGVLGTIAMLAVGGGIIAHETHILQSLENIIKAIPLGGFFSEIILGAIVGYIVVLIVPIFSKITKVFKNSLSKVVKFHLLNKICMKNICQNI